MLRLAVRSWNRLLGRLPRTQTAPEERRVGVRYSCNLETTCQPAHDPAPLRLSARVRNISRGGINLLVNCHFEPGALLSVDLPGPSGQTSCVLAYVVQVNRHEDDAWAIGCTFASELTDEDLQQFGARRVKAAEPDQRTWVRFPCEARAACKVVHGDTEEPQTIQVLNIAPGGVGLRATSPIPIGTLLSLELQNNGGETVVPIMASVVRVTNRGDDWILGCNFIRELSEGELRALV